MIELRTEQLSRVNVSSVVHTNSVPFRQAPLCTLTIVLHEIQTELECQAHACYKCVATTKRARMSSTSQTCSYYKLFLRTSSVSRPLLHQGVNAVDVRVAIALGGYQRVRSSKASVSRERHRRTVVHYTIVMFSGSH